MRNNYNIELFNCYGARVMAHLHENFPIKQHFHIKEFTGKCELKVITEDMDHSAIACATVVFLKENGFIEYNQGDSRSCLFANVTLTTKGISVLAQPMPDSIVEHRSIGEVLSKAAKDAGGEAATKILTTTIPKNVRIIIKKHKEDEKPKEKSLF